MATYDKSDMDKPDIKEAIGRQDEWPYWPYLPIKRRHLNGWECATLTFHGIDLVLIHCNIFAGTEQRKNSQLEFVTLDQLEADGWMTD